MIECKNSVTFSHEFFSYLIIKFKFKEYVEDKKYPQPIKASRIFCVTEML